jgi:HAE1 family hydrophobic/amphiphilic exporter-1
MLEIGSRIEEKLRPYWDVDPASPEARSLDYPAIADYFFVARDRQLFLGLRAADPRRARELIPLLRSAAAEIPGMFAVARQTSLFEQGLTGGRTIDVEIRGPDLVRLTALGGKVLDRVSAVVPGCQAIPQPSLDLSTPEIHVVPKREHAAAMGFTTGDIGYILDALVDGAYATDYFIGGDKIDLRIVGQEELASRTQDLEALPIATRTGDLVPLKALGDVVLTSGPEQINHRERLRAITIRVTPPAEFPLESAMERIDAEIVRPLLDGGELEGGLYQVYLSGTADKLHATWRALRFNFILALLITYLLMAALFESWLYPFVIIASVPLGTVGGFAGLWLLNRFVLQPLDVLTMLGFVILVGTVVNNPILIVEQTLIHMREEGMPMRAALLESLRNRIRPIFMTTTTTVFGLLPLVLFPGSGSELYRGIGVVVLGGLISSTLVTLVVVPSLFSLAMEGKERLLRALGRASTPPTPREPSRAAPPVERRGVEERPWPVPAELEPEVKD